MPPSLFVAYQEQEQSEADFDERDDFVVQAWRFGGPLMENLHWTDIIVTPEMQTHSNWRDSVRAGLSGQGINNQANVYAARPARIIHDELRFRHIEEQYIYEALLRRKQPFMPLPVVMRADGSKRPNGINRRIEPDFCVLYRGRLIVLEIDGGSHWETPVNADKRLQFLREQGAIIRRIAADDCKDVEKALLTINDLMKSVDSELAPGPTRERAV